MARVLFDGLVEYDDGTLLFPYFSHLALILVSQVLPLLPLKWQRTW